MEVAAGKEINKCHNSSDMANTTQHSIPLRQKIKIEVPSSPEAANDELKSKFDMKPPQCVPIKTEVPSPTEEYNFDYKSETTPMLKCPKIKKEIQDSAIDSNFELKLPNAFEFHSRILSNDVFFDPTADRVKIEDDKKPEQKLITMPEQEEIANPLNMLRQYCIEKKEIVEKDGMIVFGEHSWPKDQKTTYAVFHREKEYYTLETLLYLLKNVHLRHPVYVQHAHAAGIPLVRRPDRINLLRYLTGEPVTSKSEKRLWREAEDEPKRAKTEHKYVTKRVQMEHMYTSEGCKSEHKYMSEGCKFEHRYTSEGCKLEHKYASERCKSAHKYVSKGDKTEHRYSSKAVKHEHKYVPKGDNYEHKYVPKGDKYEHQCVSKGDKTEPKYTPKLAKPEHKYTPKRDKSEHKYVPKKIKNEPY